ncbi:MAG: GFA family protein [Chloroflexota bacterium]
MAITGRCHCGQVTYEAQGPIIKSSYCDCPGCQRATGTLKAPFVTVLRAGLKITTGEPAAFRAASGERCDAYGEWLHCHHCGSPLFWRSLEGNELDIFAGTLDDATVFQPGA